MASQIGAVLPAMEALVGIDGTGVILPEGDLPVAPGRHVLDGNGRRPAPALQPQRVLPDGAGRSPPGRHLQVRSVVAMRCDRGEST